MPCDGRGRVVVDGRVHEWIGGRRPVTEALAARRPAHPLLVSSSAKRSPKLKSLLTDARRTGVPPVHRCCPNSSRAAGFEGHAGVLLEVPRAPAKEGDA